MKISLAKTKNIIFADGIVAVPTETVYGLAGRADSKIAVAKIFAAKKRPADNPLICHFHSIEQIKKYVKEIHPLALRLLKKFSPGPISFLFELKNNSPLLPATLGRKDVVARIPSHKLFLKLLKEIKIPLAAPSANSSGSFSNTTALMVEKDLGNKIEGVLDGGTSKVGLESTIVDVRNPKQILILRPGIIGVDEIKKVLKDENIIVKNSVSKKVIPGNKYRHYAPKAKIIRLKSLQEIKKKKGFSLLTTLDKYFSLDLKTRNFIHRKGDNLIFLGDKSDMMQIASKLFSMFSKIDELQLKEIYYLEVDWGNSSIGLAIKNRIDKAIGK